MGKSRRYPARGMTRAIFKSACQCSRAIRAGRWWMFKGATVRDGAALRLGIYNRGDWTERDVWLVYKNSEETALKSSEVVLVCKGAARVLYDGSANDEG
jgi:hypothetical protein